MPDWLSESITHNVETTGDCVQNCRRMPGQRQLPKEIAGFRIQAQQIGAVVLDIEALRLLRHDQDAIGPVLIIDDGSEPHEGVQRVRIRQIGDAKSNQSFTRKPHLHRDTQKIHALSAESYLQLCFARPACRARELGCRCPASSLTSSVATTPALLSHPHHCP